MCIHVPRRPGSVSFFFFFSFLFCVCVCFVYLIGGGGWSWGSWWVPSPREIPRTCVLLKVTLEVAGCVLPSAAPGTPASFPVTPACLKFHEVSARHEHAGWSWWVSLVHGRFCDLEGDALRLRVSSRWEMRSQKPPPFSPRLWSAPGAA